MFKLYGWISRPTLRLPHVSEKASWSGRGGSSRAELSRWAWDAGGGCCACSLGHKAAVDLPRGHMCLVSLASDVLGQNR